jgi:hypothetical protein
VGKLTRVQVGNLLLRPLIISSTSSFVQLKCERRDSQSQSRIFGMRTILDLLLGRRRGKSTDIVTRLVVKVEVALLYFNSCYRRIVNAYLQPVRPKQVKGDTHKQSGMARLHSLTSYKYHTFISCLKRRDRPADSPSCFVTRIILLQNNEKSSKV